MFFFPFVLSIFFWGQLNEIVMMRQVTIADSDSKSSNIRKIQPCVHSNKSANRERNKTLAMCKLLNSIQSDSVHGICICKHERNSSVVATWNDSQIADTREWEKDLLFLARYNKKTGGKGERRDLHTWVIEFTLVPSSAAPGLSSVSFLFGRYPSKTKREDAEENILYGLFTRFVVVIIISLFFLLFLTKTKKPRKKIVRNSLIVLSFYRWFSLVLFSAQYIWTFPQLFHNFTLFSFITSAGYFFDYCSMQMK